MAQSDKLERLMNLTAALLDAERPLTADDIAERVTGYAEGKEAFRRTFERDKEELRQLGIPILTGLIPGRYPEEHGYRIDRADYELPDPGLAPDELAALRLALQAVRVGEQSGDGSEALWKLGGLVDADDAAERSSPPRPRWRHCRPIRRWCRSSAPCSSDGWPDSSTPSTAGDGDRVVEPWRLDYRRGRWYLTAYDHDRARGAQLPARPDQRAWSASTSRAPSPVRRPARPPSPTSRGPTATAKRSSPCCASTASRPAGPSISSAPTASS